jgi:hypothetical protein
MQDRRSLIGAEASSGDRFSRRKLIKKAAGTAGAGIIAGTSLSKPLLADEDDDRRVSQGVEPLPLPYINPANLHNFFAGPVEGTAAPTDPTGAQPNGRDPSTITNFNGFIGQVDLDFSGMATDLVTGAQSPYDFHTDLRFMRGAFIGSDERRHHGTFGFI